ncbi:hypothetical protein CEXT_106861 [Caerostris extrusa]|uniref:Uncharacterized protein n=1 Tax=Caerostris extrusa TaxID=172846 RepID=A0AAV4Y9N5_CAEEX|nr:hypothetical protein CEXT_106861 [Caerostris extrusa]
MGIPRTCLHKSNDLSLQFPRITSESPEPSSCIIHPSPKHKILVNARAEGTKKGLQHTGRSRCMWAKVERPPHHHDRDISCCCPGSICIMHMAGASKAPSIFAAYPWCRKRHEDASP